MKKYFYLVVVALTAAFTLTACSDDDDTAENARPAEGTEAYFDAVHDSICGVYLDAFEMYENQYFSVFKFLEDNTALSILYSKKPSSDTIEVDTTKLSWKIDKQLIAKSEGKNYYTLYRYAPLVNFGLSQEIVDTLVAEGIPEIYTDTMVVAVDTNGHIQLFEQHSDAEDDSSADTRLSWDDIKNLYHEVKNVIEDTVDDVIEDVKDELNKVTFTSKILAEGPVYRDWMSYIDDRAPLRCVSIPGTHDTFTYGISRIAYSYGCTQWLSLEQQFDKGVRCFDLRLDYYKEGALEVNINYPRKNGDEDNLFLTHGGMVSCGISFNDALDKIHDCLMENRTETAIVVVSLDNSSIKGETRDHAFELMDQVLVKRAQAQQIAAWDPNMTMKDARSKMVVIARYPTKQCLFPIACQKGTTSTLKWGDNKDDQQLLVDYDGTYQVTNPLWVQDYYEQHSGESDDEWFKNKEKLIKENLDYLNSVDLEKEENCIWAFNQTSACLGTWKVDMNYPIVAETINPYMTGLLENDYKGKFTGIIVMDYAGVNVKATGNISIIGHETHGDILPQAIIRNNNYLKLGDLNIAKESIY